MSYNTVQLGVVIVTPVLFFCSASVTCLRLFDRYLRRARLTFDDWAVIATLLATLAYTIATLVWVSRYYLGYNHPLNPDEFYKYSINRYVQRVLYATAFDWAKCCIVLFYLRITDRRVRVVYWWFLAVVLGLCFFKWILHLLILLLQCIPVSFFYRARHPGAMGHCLATATQAIVINVFTFLTEACIVVAPLPMLWMAGLSQSQKAALAGMFSLALLIVIASALKLRAVIAATKGEAAYQYGIAVIWTGVETNVALFVAGMLPLKNLLHMSFRRFKRRLSGQTDTDRSEGSSAGHETLTNASPSTELWPAHEAALFAINSNEPKPQARSAAALSLKAKAAQAEGDATPLPVLSLPPAVATTAGPTAAEKSRADADIV